MADIVTFVSRAELDAQTNLDGFIGLCRTQLSVFGPELDFDRDVWDVTASIHLKARHKALRLVFSNLETVNDRTRVMMREPFLSFAKSYMRYQHSMRPTKHVGGRLAALRALESALLETGTASPIRVDAHVLNCAAMKIHQHQAAGTAYRTAGQLEMIADFLREHWLTSVLVHWHNPLKRPVEGFRVGERFDERRAAKMPSESALNSIPKVFLMATEPGDVIVSSVIAILCSAPDRINEVLLLPENCEVMKGNAASSRENYGLRWWPAKGADPMIKWVIPSMSEVVANAVGKIRRLTDEARRIAKWYEAHPDEIYLPAESEHLRKKEWLSMSDVAEILFVGPARTNSSFQWCKRNLVPSTIYQRQVYVRFDDLQSAVVKLLPAGFPIMNRETGLKYSEALFVVPSNLLHANKAAYRCLVHPVSQDQIHAKISAVDRCSIFKRYGLFEPDGSSIRVTSHQFRHFLNTLAQTGGMSQLDIAKWSGRKDVRQNERYDHEPKESLLTRVREAIGDDTRMFGPLSTAPRKVLIPRDQFASLKVPTAHATDFGYCIHDYVMAPCQLHRDCLNCEELVCVKGMPETDKRIRQAHEEVARLTGKAEEAAAEGDFGAADWMEHHRLQLTRLTELVEILDNPAVPSGAFIQLAPLDIPSRLDHAAEARVALAVSDVEVGTDILSRNNRTQV